MALDFRACEPTVFSLWAVKALPCLLCLFHYFKELDTSSFNEFLRCFAKKKPEHGPGRYDNTDCLWLMDSNTFFHRTILCMSLGQSLAMVLHGDWGYVIFRRRNGDKGTQEEGCKSLEMEKIKERQETTNAPRV